MNKQYAIDFEKRKVKKTIPDFGPGDTVSVRLRIEEGGKERVQTFRGTCIGRHGSAMSETFTVRKITQGYGIERVFPAQCPALAEVTVEKRGKVRRAKLYYLRHLSGRATRISERIERDGEDAAAQPAAAEAPAAGT